MMTSHFHMMLAVRPSQTSVAICQGERKVTLTKNKCGTHDGGSLPLSEAHLEVVGWVVVDHRNDREIRVRERNLHMLAVELETSGIVALFITLISLSINDLVVVNREIDLHFIPKVAGNQRIKDRLAVGFRGLNMLLTTQRIQTCAPMAMI